MPSARKTPNYNLTQYADNGTDKVSFMGDYNEDMSKIDTALKNNDNAISVKEDKTAHATDVAAINANIDEKEDKTAHATDVAAINAAVALKEDKTAHASDVAAINAAVALKEDKTAHASDVAAINANIDKKADASSVYTRTDIDSQLIKYINKIPHNIVCIGDSYGEGYGTTNPNTDNMYVQMGNILGTTVHNYSVGGAGFVHGASTGGGHQYGVQITQASQELSSVKNSVDLVIITGGQNDNGLDFSQINSAVSQSISDAHAAFPYARILFYPMMYGANPLSTALYQLYTNLVQVGKASGAQVIEGAYTALRGRFEYVWATDWLHPNTVGAKFLGGVLANIVMGGDGFIPQLGGFSVGGAATVLDGANYASYDHGIVSIRAAIKPAAGHGKWSANEPLCFIPKFCKTANPTTYFPCMMTSGEFALIGIKNNDNDTAPALIVAQDITVPNEILINTTLGPVA